MTTKLIGHDPKPACDPPTADYRWYPSKMLPLSLPEPGATVIDFKGNKDFWNALRNHRAEGEDTTD